MAQKMKVTFLDGAVHVVVATPRAQVETERFLKGYSENTLVEAGYRLAFESLKVRKLIDSVLGYEEWLDLVEDVEEVEPEPAADPTPEAPSSTPSSV